MPVDPTVPGVKPPYRLAASVLLILAFLSVVLYFFLFFNTRWQLVSPLIPEKMVSDIAAPYLRLGIGSALMIIPAAVQYRARRYGWSALISIALLTIQQIAHSLT